MVTSTKRLCRREWPGGQAMSHAEQDSLEAQIGRVTVDLRREFADVPEDEVRELVAERFDAYADSPIRTYLPIIVQREVRRRLRRTRGPGPQRGAA